MRCLTFLVVLQVLNGSCAYAAESCETDELAAVQVLRRSEDARPRRLIRKFKRAIYEWSKKKHYYYKTTTPAPPPPSPPPSPPSPGCGKGCCTFNRIGFFQGCQQLDATCNSTERRFKIDSVDVTEDLKTAVYTSTRPHIGIFPVGFVDITDAAVPTPLGTLGVELQPTDVAIKGFVALVPLRPVNSNQSAGQLMILNVTTQTVLHTIELGGQPDSVDISPDENWAAITIENEAQGTFPEAPPGFLVRVNISDPDPMAWTTDNISLTGLPGLLFPEDPEPEQVSIRSDNVAVVTLQENNAIVLVNLTNASVISSFSAGTVNISDIDIFEDRRIILNSTLTNVSREPDGVVWLGKKSEFFATADEGDFQGGSRSFTVFNENGEIAYSSGNLLEIIAVRLGHYPDERSENRGVEPENLAYGQFQNCEMLFVQSERSSLTYVFEVSNASDPRYLQALPAIRTPERGRVIPRRNLYITASEDSDLDLDIRSGLNIYQCQSTQYPFLESANVNGLPIPWGSIAGLTGEGNDTLWAVEGAFFAEPQILSIQSTRHPPRINRAISITYPNGTFLQNLNISGIDINDEGFVIVDQTTDSLLLLNNNGVLQDSFAINGSDSPSGVAYDPDVGYVVTTYGGTVLVCNLTTPVCGEKTFTYPLDAPESQDGGVVALRDIAALGDGHFLFLETDGQGGFDAAVRRIYKAELPEGNETMIEKTLVEDFLLELQDLRGPVLQRFDSLAVTGDLEEPYMDKLTLWVVNDNGGTDDTNGETQLLPLIQHFYQ